MLFSCRNPLTRACYPTFAAELENDVRKRENCLLSEIRKQCAFCTALLAAQSHCGKSLAGQKFGLQISLVSGAGSVTSSRVREELKTFQLLNNEVQCLCRIFLGEMCN